MVPSPLTSQEHAARTVSVPLWQVVGVMALLLASVDCAFEQVRLAVPELKPLFSRKFISTTVPLPIRPWFSPAANTRSELELSALVLISLLAALVWSPCLACTKVNFELS